jgi:hypothetical protein
MTSGAKVSIQLHKKGQDYRASRDNEKAEASIRISSTRRIVFAVGRVMQHSRSSRWLMPVSWSLGAVTMKQSEGRV